MALFVPKTYEQILQRIVNRIVARTKLTDLSETSEGKTIAAATAREVEDLYYAASLVLAAFSFRTAAGRDLDDRAADFGLTRRAATKATGSQTFTRAGTTGTLTIPAGVRVSVPGSSPEIVVVTTASGSITPGNTVSGLIAATAEKAGSRGNVALNTLTVFKGAKPAGVISTKNPGVFAGGQDLEIDDAFRERIIRYIASLARCTVFALEFISQTVSVVSGKHVVFSRAVEDPVKLGKVYLYVDDGNGTAVETDDNTGSPETLTSGVDFPGNVAQGGEQYLYTDNFPIDETESFILKINGGAALTRDVDFTLNPASGQIFLFTALTAGDAATAEYTWYVALIKAVQKVIDGDPTDRTNFPGWRAAGVLVVVREPTVINFVVSMGLVVLDGFDRTAVLAAVQNAIVVYINSVGIGGDVIVNEMVQRAMEVPGVFDLQVFAPVANISVLPDQLPRVAGGDVTVT